MPFSKRLALLAGTAALVLAFALPTMAEEDASLRGIVRAVNEAWISSDLGARIDRLPLREGQEFATGDLLAAFNCAGLAAELKSAEAKYRGEQLTFQNNLRLAKSRAAGRFEVELSEVKAAQAGAEVEAYRAKMEQCEIRAPYAGRIAQLRAHAHEIPPRTEPMMQIVGVDALEIDLLLPAAWLRWLKPGASFRMAVDETGAAIAAEVVRIAPVVDPVSQTVKVIGRFTGGTKGVLPGMSGPAAFVVPHG